MALVLVLAFVALLTFVVLAFFSQALAEQQISHASADWTKTKLLADGAIDTVIADLKAEMAAGAASKTTNADGSLTYSITNAANMMPESVGFARTGELANLVSYSGESLYTGATNRGAGGERTTATNTIERSISKDRWNKPLFLPDTTSAKSIFDNVRWIPVTPNGVNTARTVGRYAYVIYDEGGLLDINVVGYPDALVGNDAMKRKIGLPYVNLTDLRTSSGVLFTREEAKTLTDWRDFASASSIASDTDKEKAYARLVSGNSTGFLRSKTPALFEGKSDQKFVSRQQLIDFIFEKLNSTGAKTALQYLTTFSRDLNQPSYVFDRNSPAVLPTTSGGNDAGGKDDQINPGKAISGGNPTFPAGFLSIRVQSGFDRNDGTRAIPGEPFLKERFDLNRLAWLTWEGPSAIASAATKKALNDLGISQVMIDAGTATNIEKYFGLTWKNGFWEYKIHAGPMPQLQSGATREIRKLGDIASLGGAAREADFFEILKASINVGSLGKSAVTSNSTVTSTYTPSGYSYLEVPTNYRYFLDASVDYHIIQIAANIINQFHPDGYPRQISFDDGSSRGAMTFSGNVDLPYLAYIYNGVLRLTKAAPEPPGDKNVDGTPYSYPIAQNASTSPLGDQGSGMVMQVPAVWNPYDPNGSYYTVGPTKFRIVVDSNDPLALSAGDSNRNVYFAGSGDVSLTQGSQSTKVFSYDATDNPTSKTGVPVHDEVTFSSTTPITSFREPTLLFKANNGNITVTRTAGNLTSLDDNPVYGVTTMPAGTSFAPLCLGKFPLRFTYQDGATKKVISSGVALMGPGGNVGEQRVYFTYRLQYQNSSGDWITYDTKYGRTSNGRAYFIFKGKTYTPTLPTWPEGGHPTTTWAMAMDPRTSRFGLFYGGVNSFNGDSIVGPPSARIRTGTEKWIDANGEIALPIRPDGMAGHMLPNFDASDPFVVKTVNNGSTSGMFWDCPMTDTPFPREAAGWTQAFVTQSRGTYIPVLAPGMYAQNNVSTALYPGRYAGDNNDNQIPSVGKVQPAYYADGDGVVRRGDGAYLISSMGNKQSSNSPVGQPSASTQNINNSASGNVVPYTSLPFNQAQSRPLMLHRPFRSVAELGYVFRDLPWKSIDFSTPESGDAALLDVFCIGDTSASQSLSAGKVNLNTQQPAVLQAIVNGAYIDDPEVANATVGAITPTLGASIADALVARTKDASTASYGPLRNVAELIGKWTGSQSISSTISYTPSLPQSRDLQSPYIDGKISYSGFSGDYAGTGGVAKELSAVYGGDTSSLKTSISQIKRFREAPIRALESVGQTRVWNFMIDMIVQTGRPVQGGGSGNQFKVEGEQRYWVHVAMDRLSGKVLDKQIELVEE